MDRIKWVDDNTEDILKMAEGKLISQAENKLLFISFCFEYLNYIEALKNKREFFMSHLPVQLDASCNGFQHLTLLLNDLGLADNLNLKNST